MGAAASEAIPSGILNTKWLWSRVSLRAYIFDVKLDLPWDTAVGRVATIRHTAIRELVGKGVGGVLAVVLVAAATIFTVGLQARVGLRSDADAVADLDALLGLAANADSLADDLVANAAGLL